MPEIVQHPGDLDDRIKLLMQTVDDDISWYTRRIRGFRLATAAIRVVGFASIAVATVLPAFAQGAEGYRYAYAALLFGGVAVAANRVWMISATWVRYIQAEMAMTIAKRNFDLQWATAREELAVSGANPRVKALELVSGLIKVIDQTKLEETRGWGEELREAMTSLREDIDKSATKVKGALEALEADDKARKDEDASKAAARKGGLIVSISSSATAKGSVVVTAGGKSVTAQTVPAVLLLPDLPEGQTIVRAHGFSDKGASLGGTATAKVVANETEQVEVKLA